MTNLKENLFGVTSVVAILVSILFIYTIISGFNVYAKMQQGNNKLNYLIFLLFLTTYFFLLVYTIVYSQKLKKLILKNFKLNQNNEIEAIGKNKLYN